MKWTAHIEGGPRRVNHAAVCMSDKILSFGGYCSTEEYKDWDPIPVHVLNTETLRWSAVNYKETDLVPFQRYGHTTVAYGEKVYMWGGRNNAVSCDRLAVFDTRTLEWSTPSVSGLIPYAKDGHSACVIKNRMYIFGGFEYHTDQYSQEVHYLDLDHYEWYFVETKGRPPSNRDFHTAVAYEDKMYVFGGRGDKHSAFHSQEEIYCSQIYCLDTKTEKWTALNPKRSTWPEGRRSHSAWIYNGYMYIFGGYNGNSKFHFNDLMRYSLKDNYWERIFTNGQAPSKRRRQACIMLKDKMFLFGGTSPQPAKNVPIRATNNSNNDDEHLLDNNDLHILDYAPTLKTLCMMKVLEHNLDYTALPRHIIMDIRSMSQPNRISRPVNQAG